MARYSMHQVAQLAHDVGWSYNEAIVATAIAWAESGGVTDAIGDVGLQTSVWGPSVGLWQIRSLNSERGTGGVRDGKANLNPRINAIHAHAVWAAARSFKPWSTYLHGTHTRHLDAARKAVDDVVGSRTLSRFLLYRSPMQYGADVRACQAIVRCHQDGWFGPVTREHVQTWQHEHRLTADGIVGPLTARTFGWRWSR